MAAGAAVNAGYVYQERLGAESRGRTVLAHLVERYRHSSEQEWAARLARGEVSLDGVPASGAELCLAGRLLSWSRPPWEEAPVPLHFELAHEDEGLLAVIKPSGLPTLPSGGYLEHTLLHLVRRTYPEASALHRLGRGTSGLVLFSRTAEVGRRLGSAWRAQQVWKRYRALASGRADQERYEIHAAIGEVPHPRLGTVFGARADGKASHSTARVLARRVGETLFEVDLHTGRPDQIRIHLAFIGHPLVGDPLFAAGGLPKAELPGLPGDTGYLLHAERLDFDHPMTGARMSLWAPPPEALR